MTGARGLTLNDTSNNYFFRALQYAIFELLTKLSPPHSLVKSATIDCEPTSLSICQDSIPSIKGYMFTREFLLPRRQLPIVSRKHRARETTTSPRKIRMGPKHNLELRLVLVHVDLLIFLGCLIHSYMQSMNAVHESSSTVQQASK